MSCNSDHKFKKVSFYHWKTEYKLSTYEKEYLASLGSKKIYFKAFDVVDNEPVGVLRWKDAIRKGYDYIPVIFIEP